MEKKLLILLGILWLTSCVDYDRTDYKKIVLTDFSKKRKDTLVPHKNKSYVGYYLKVKGTVNDTVKFQREGGYYEIVLSGKVDTLVNGDYYGGEKVIWTFDPYRADTGNLEVEYGL